MTDRTLGQRIADERKKLNLSQVGLATRLDVSRQAISKWESDAAIPEIDKLIALSKLFGVTVGWLLGVEAPATAPSEPLSEDQFRIVEELVRKYQTPPKPHLTAFHYLFAVGISLLVFLFVFGQTSRIEQQLVRTEETYRQISNRLAIVESAVLNRSGSLLADYTLDTYPLTMTKSAHRVKVTFSATPNVWNSETSGYLCINADSSPAVRIPCRWDGSHLTAETTLDVVNGYNLCFAAEHPGGSQEQQVLEDSTLTRLADACTIPMDVEQGTFSYRDGTLMLTDYAVSLGLPSIYRGISAIPNVTHCELRLYRRPRNDSRYELIRADVSDQLEHGLSAGHLYRVPLPPVSFENVNIKDCNHLRLVFYVKLSSGVERELPLRILIPDGSGGLTE